MKKLYAYCYGKNNEKYDYIIIEKKGFDNPKIVQQGSCTDFTFNNYIERTMIGVYIYTKRKDYAETCNILKSLIKSN